MPPRDGDLAESPSGYGSRPQRHERPLEVLEVDITESLPPIISSNAKFNDAWFSVKRRDNLRLRLARCLNCAGPRSAARYEIRSAVYGSRVVSGFFLSNAAESERYGWRRLPPAGKLSSFLQGNNR